MLVYVHIPFCHRVCPYCSFYKHTPGKTPIGGFVEALALEASHRLEELAPTTLYLGGGTPSMLSPRHLEHLFEALHLATDLNRLEEFTLEANPATFDLAKARLFKNWGVTRVSLGIQSFSPEILTTLGREHSPAQAVEAVGLLREAGIAQINIDLMFSVPGQSLAMWEADLAQAVALAPDHISAYNLTYEEDTAFFESLRRGEVMPSEDRDLAHFEVADTTLTDCGWLHYETSNYARPGCESKHNRGYWRGDDYIGLGPSAVSTIGNQRWKNVADTESYIRQAKAFGHAIGECELLDREAWRLERIALGLRTCDGIPLELLDQAGRERAKVLVDEKLAMIKGKRLVLVDRGRALVDPIAAELI